MLMQPDHGRALRLYGARVFLRLGIASPAPTQSQITLTAVGPSQRAGEEARGQRLGLAWEVRTCDSRGLAKGGGVLLDLDDSSGSELQHPAAVTVIVVLTVWVELRYARAGACLTLAV